MSETAHTTLAPDESVPARDALLDPSAFAQAVARAASLPPITRCTRRRARYQPGRSLRVLYELELAEKTLLVAVRTFQTDHGDVARKGLLHAVTTDSVPPVFALPELRAVAWVYPNDRKLHALATLTEITAALLGREPVDAELVSWAPEKSATVRYGDAYAKTYADSTASKEYRLHEYMYKRLEGDDLVAVPRVLAGNDSVLVVEAACGTPLARIEGSAAPEAYAWFGQALAHLHALPPRQDASARDVLHRALAAARVLARARPDVAEDVDELGRALASGRPEPSVPVCIHGDAHPKNVLIDGAKVSLIDVEQVAAGDAAGELGSVLAAIAYRSLVGDQSLDGCASAFLEGYAAARPLPTPASLAWHEAASLLSERALRSVTRVRDEGLLHMDALLGRARELVDRAQP